MEGREGGRERERERERGEREDNLTFIDVYLGIILLWFKNKRDYNPFSSLDPGILH
jgi:hypothetical protein